MVSSLSFYVCKCDCKKIKSYMCGSHCIFSIRQWRFSCSHQKPFSHPFLLFSSYAPYPVSATQKLTTFPTCATRLGPTQVQGIIISYCLNSCNSPLTCLQTFNILIKVIVLKHVRSCLFSPANPPMSSHIQSKS